MAKPILVLTETCLSPQELYFGVLAALRTDLKITFFKIHILLCTLCLSQFIRDTILPLYIRSSVKNLEIYLETYFFFSLALQSLQ